MSTPLAESTATIIDGRALADQYIADIRASIIARQDIGSRLPGIAVILVGDDPASRIYVKYKRRACEEVGMLSRDYDLTSDTPQQELVSIIQNLNQDDAIDGILVQLPLPEQIGSRTIIESIRPDKDADGFHPYNMGRLALRIPTLRPCTPQAVIALLDSVGETYKGRDALVVGASNLVGRPMGLELLLRGASTSVCHRFTTNLRKHVELADILVVATGVPELIKGEWIKPGATVIDVGIRRMEDGRLIGDVEFDEACKRAAYISPVPGGVGPMTIAMLLKNTLQACEEYHSGTGTIPVV